MAEWLEVAEARSAAGVRLVLSVGVPGPWGEAAKALLQAKGIGFTAVCQRPGEPNAELAAWTGESNAPQLVIDDEPPLDRWNDLILRIEGLAPEPCLIPTDPAVRARMFGWVHELAGEQGFGWNRRLMLLAPVMAMPGAADTPALAGVVTMARRYGFDEAGAAAAPERCAAILRVLGEQLRRQREAGRRYLFGDAVSALDLYWAAFAALVDPLPPELCPMPDHVRRGYAMHHPVIDDALDPELLAHRDFIYREHLVLPLDLGV